MTYRFLGKDLAPLDDTMVLSSTKDEADKGLPIPALTAEAQAMFQELLANSA
jgi:hypothetical protein